MRRKCISFETARLRTPPKPRYYPTCPGIGTAFDTVHRCFNANGPSKFFLLFDAGLVAVV